MRDIRRLRPAWILLCTLLLISCTNVVRSVRRLSDSPSPSESQQHVLISFSQALRGFKPASRGDPEQAHAELLLQKAANSNHFRGWDSSRPCGGSGQSVTDDVRECNPENQVYKSAAQNSWTGVTCNSAEEVVCVHLEGYSISGSAEAIPTLAGLSNLGYLNLAGNKLTGSLPAQLGSALTSLRILDLSSNEINSTLGARWGSPGAWEDLQQLQLQSNRLYGTLPDSWGSDHDWESLSLLDLSENHLQGSIPASYGSNNSTWPSLQSAVVQPGNSLCGEVPSGFPAVKQTGAYVTGPTYEAVQDFDSACSADSEVVPIHWTGDQSGDDLSRAAIAGIITGEVLMGAFLLLFSATIHRRYRWRHERSWVLFDWDVVADTPPKPLIRFGTRFGWGSKSQSGNETLGPETSGLLPNGSPVLGPTLRSSQSPAKLSTGLEVGDSPGTLSPVPPAQAPSVAQAEARDQRVSLGNFSDLIWQDSLLPPDDVVIQQNPDGSLRQLGNGSFGKVYKGVLQQVHEVAVKVFEGYAGQHEQDLLLKEISILRSCRNNNIVQFFGVSIRDDDIWMIMELMDGNLFRHLARGHHCTWYFRGRSIALDIARGMHFLHTRRIIHMDLKSPNILLSSTGAAKIADVGLARVMGSESIANQVCAGTMHWMAPEVLICGQCTEKADVFSFGVILWEICTAEAPTRGRMSAVSVPDECPDEVAKLIDWCMEEDPEKRPSALEIIQEIQAIPVTAKPVPQPPWYAR